MFDEQNFFNMSAADAAARLAEWQTRHRQDRTRPMALLLTELQTPEVLAATIKQSLAAEAAPLLRLIASHDKMLADWKIQNHGVDPMNPLKSVPWPLTKERFLNLPMVPFVAEREMLDAALAAIRQEQAQCDQRLAARLADMAAGLTQRRPDATEEPDPIIQIWAGRLREGIEVRNDRITLDRLRQESQRRLMELRRPK